jgi:hypothetical protein
MNEKYYFLGGSMDGQEVPEYLRREGTLIRVPIINPLQIATTVFPTLAEEPQPLEMEEYRLSPPWQIGTGIVRHLYVLDSLSYYAAMELFFDQAMADRAARRASRR